MPAVSTALKILDYLAHNVSEAGVSEIARALEINKSTCFNILATLQANQVVTKHPRYAVYCLGPKLIELGTVSRRSMAQGSQLHEHITNLAHDLGLTCLIGQVLADGSGIVIIDRVVPYRSEVSVLPVGHVVPMSGPAMGRAVLASRDDPDDLEFARSLGMLPSGDESVFIDQLDAIRRAGYATSIGEYDPRVNAVAAVANRRPSAEVVLCVIGLQQHLPKSALSMVGSRLVDLIHTAESFPRAGSPLLGRR